MPRFDATINGKSLASYGITPTTATVPQPDAKTYQADIPGRDGMLDYTDAFGVIRYDNRTITVEAYEIGDIAARIDHRRAICSDMHGKSCKLSLSTLDGYTFNGRCNVEYEEDGSQTVYTLSFDCEPYMSAGERTFYANCAGGADLVFISGDKPVKPRIEVPRRSIIVFEGNQYEVDKGTWTFDDIIFKRGRNELYVNTYTEPGTTTWGDLQSMTWEQIAWHHRQDTVSGELVNVTDALQARPNTLMVAGKSVQDGTPTPDAPMPIVNVTSPVRIRTHDGIFYIKHSGGLFDWAVTNADNLTWYFPDGTTSNANRPSRTIDAGTVKVVCDDWTKASIEINDNETNSAFVGDLSDFPPVTNYLIVGSCKNLTGNIADLPPVSNILSMYNCKNLTGNIADLPPVTYNLSMGGCSNITGDLSDLPPVTSYLSMGGCSNITGDLSDLPPVTSYLIMGGCSNITGDLSDLPPVTSYLSMGGCQLVTGVLSVAGTVKEIYLQGTGMSASDTDQTLINLAATTTVTSGGTLQIKKNRTSASDAAFAYLSSRFTITEV